MNPGILVFAAFSALLLNGCEQISQQLGVEDLAKKEARADGKQTVKEPSRETAKDGKTKKN